MAKNQLFLIEKPSRSALSLHLSRIEIGTLLILEKCSEILQLFGQFLGILLDKEYVFAHCINSMSGTYYNSNVRIYASINKIVLNIFLFNFKINYLLQNLLI